MSSHSTIRVGKEYHIWRDGNDPGFVFIGDNDGNILRFSEDQAKEIAVAIIHAPVPLHYNT